jgi:hypothetical protein
MQEALRRAEAASLQLPQERNCEECEHKGTLREGECWQCEQDAKEIAAEFKFDCEQEDFDEE